jgi:hypothetical protein
MQGEDVPEAEAPVTGGGRQATSGARCGPSASAIELAVLDAAHVSDGRVVGVDGRRATVRPVPIDDPRKLRPRSDQRNSTTVD